MNNRQFHPLELNPLTNEPFLRLQNHENIILTPPRSSDKDPSAAILNDPRVHDWLTGPPIPYLHEHAEAWYGIIKPLSDGVIAELEAAHAKPDLIIVDQCPVRAIREVLNNGEEVYLGDIEFIRLRDGRILAPPNAVVDKESASRYATENAERVAGDPDIVWTVGYYLAPSHHGRGIMPDALKTILYEWAVPRMNARRVCVSALDGNQPSLRVFQKNGFRLTGWRENYVEARGKTHGIHILEWKIEESGIV